MPTDVTYCGVCNPSPLPAWVLGIRRDVPSTIHRWDCPRPFVLPAKKST